MSPNDSSVRRLATNDPDGSIGIAGDRVGSRIGFGPSVPLVDMLLDEFGSDFEDRFSTEMIRP